MTALQEVEERLAQLRASLTRIKASASATKAKPKPKRVRHRRAARPPPAPRPEPVPRMRPRGKRRHCDECHELVAHDDFPGPKATTCTRCEADLATPRKVVGRR